MADGGAAGGTGSTGGSGGADGGAGAATTCIPGCPPSQVCTGALACVDAYRLTLLAPVAGSVVNGFVTVQARLERAGPGVAPPSRVELRNSRGSPVLPMSPIASDGLATVYAVDYWTPERTEAPLTLTVAAVAPWGEVTGQVTVEVDTWAPRQLQGLAIDCGSVECRPDATLVIREQIADARLLDASASVELDGYSRKFPFAATGTGFVVTIPLRELPFPYFERAVQVALTARDAAGNVGTEVLGIPVRRFQWRRQFQVPATSPAVGKDGTLVLGLSRSYSQLVALHPDGSDAWQLTLAPSGSATPGNVTAPPSIGASAIWVGSEDGRVYAVDPTGAGILNGVEGGRGCDTGAVVKVSPALSYGGIEVAFAPSGTSVVAADLGRCVPSDAQEPYLASAVLAQSDEIAVASTTGKYLRYSFALAFRLLQTVSIGPTTSSPALDSVGSLWAGATDGWLYAVGTRSTSKWMGSAAPISSSPVIAANGDIIFGDDAGVLHRYTPAGVKVWPVEPDLGGAVRAPLLLAGGDVEILVPTANGKLVGLRGDGTVLWSTGLAAGQDLREANLYTPPGQAGRVFSTAYLGCGDGSVYAVMVDGQLDPAAPWPRAHHDPRNTGNVRGPRP